jgi:ABC-2 type transport system permease protein
MIMMLCGMFCIIHEIEHKKYTRIITGAQSLTGALIIGKAIPIILIFGIVISIVQFILFPVFNIFIPGPPIVLLILILLFLIASLLPGFALGAILKNPLIATEVIIFINMPTLLLSGYTFPAVPKILADVAQVLPFTHFMIIFFRIGQMNCPLVDVTGDIVKLIYFILIGFLITWISLIRLNKSMEKVGCK